MGHGRHARMVHRNIACTDGEIHGRPAPHHRPLDQHFAIGCRCPPAPDAHRQRALRRTPAQGGRRVAGRVHAAQDASRVLAAMGRIQRRLSPALGALLGHLAPARQPVARARSRGQAACAHVQVRDDRRRPRLCAAREPCAGADHSTQRRRRRRHQAALRDRRSARGPWPGYRRLQGGLGGRRRALGRPSGVLRDLFPRSVSGPDACRRDGRRSRIHPHRGRAPSAQPEARDHRQLPGRVGGDDARGRAAGHRGPARDQRRADVVLVGQRRRFADALHGWPAGRRVAVAVLGRPGRGQVRRRQSRLQFRIPESRRIRCGTSGTTCSKTSTPSRNASSSSNAGGAASTRTTRKRSAGSSTTCSSATSSRPARRGWVPDATST